MTSKLICSQFLASLFALCLLAASAPATAAAKDDWAFNHAVEQHQRGQWSDASGRFIVLANNGDRDATRIALFMLSYGPRLYASHWDASPDDAEEWKALVNQSPTTFRATPVFKPCTDDEAGLQPQAVQFCSIHQLRRMS